MAVEQLLSDFCDQHRLDVSFHQTAKKFYIPLAEKLITQLSGEPYVLGINGCQGSGKSTLADFVRHYLTNQHQKNVVNVSIDDIYLTKKEREYLSQYVHPLLQTRGVPGTHDVDLGLHIVQSLKQLRSGETLAIPRFDKLKDDRCDRSGWTQAAGPIDLIIFEGWCVGAVPQETAALDEPVNDLEKKEDPFGKWRQHANKELQGVYADLFAQIDSLVLLKAPRFESVFDWRLEQERKLAASLNEEDATHEEITIMSEADIGRFVQHYERITRHNLEVLPDQADVIYELDDTRKISNATYRSY